MAQQLQLIVKENTVGKILTNIDELEKFVETKISEYNPDSYDGDIKSAKADRAELNASVQVLDNARKAVIADYMKPVVDFENRMKVLASKVKTASSAIDVVVKKAEAEEKEAKRNLIQNIFDEKNCDLITLDKIFDKKWLNKSCKLTDIRKEIDTRIADIYKDLQTIDRFAEDAETVKAFYLDCLDIADALDFGEQLQKNKAKVAVEAETRVDREIKERVEEQKLELREEVKDFSAKSSLSSIVGDALEVEIKPELKEYVINICCTESQSLALKDYLNKSNITYSQFEEVSF